VVEQHLAGKDSELKESIIAMEVFGRRLDHDLRRDSVVRTDYNRPKCRKSQLVIWHPIIQPQPTLPSARGRGGPYEPVKIAGS
jgi:hypothetical protein